MHTTTDEFNIPNLHEVSKALLLVLKELEYQENKHGQHNATLLPFSSEMMCYIMEEVGESAQTLNDLKSAERNKTPQQEDLRGFYVKELTQVAALAVNEIARILSYQNQNSPAKSEDNLS